MLLFEDRPQFFFLVEVLRQIHSTDQPVQFPRKLRFILLAGNRFQVMPNQLGKAPAVFSGINLSAGNDRLLDGKDQFGEHDTYVACQYTYTVFGIGNGDLIFVY